MSCVHYKFSSKLDYNTVTFDGLHITLNELKRQIMARERLKATDCDLQITNAQTREEYTDDEIHIPKHSSVIVRRTPIGGVKPAGRTFIIDRSDTAMVGSSRPTDSSPSMSLAQLSKTANLADANASEEDKIKAMISQSIHDYDPIHYSKKAIGPPPGHYICFRCGKTGHYIRQCPLQMDKSLEGPKPVKISKGIPQSFMVKAEPDAKGAMLTSTGEYAIPAIDAEAYAQGKKERPPFVPRDQSASEDESDPIPDELLCPICNDLMSDAVVIPCCGNSYCDDCIRTSLLDSEEHVCYTCKQSDVSPDNLIANKFLRQAVNNFKNETGYTKLGRKQLQQVAPSVPRPLPPRHVPSRQQDPLMAHVAIPPPRALPPAAPAVAPPQPLVVLPPPVVSAPPPAAAAATTTAAIVRQDTPPLAPPPTQDSRDRHDNRDVHDNREIPDNRDLHDARDNREHHDNRDARDSRDHGDARDTRDHHDNRDHHDPRHDPRDQHHHHHPRDQHHHDPRERHDVHSPMQSGGQREPPPPGEADHDPHMMMNQGPPHDGRPQNCHHPLIGHPPPPRPLHHQQGPPPRPHQPHRGGGPVGGGGPRHWDRNFRPREDHPPPRMQVAPFPPNAAPPVYAAPALYPPPPQIYPPPYSTGPGLIPPPPVGYQPQPMYPPGMQGINPPWMPPNNQHPLGPHPPPLNQPHLSKEEFYRQHHLHHHPDEVTSKLDEFTKDFHKELMKYCSAPKRRRRSYTRSRTYSRSPFSRSPFSRSRSRSRSYSYTPSRSRSRSRNRSYPRSPFSRRNGRSYGRTRSRSRSRSRPYTYRRSGSPRSPGPYRPPGGQGWDGADGAAFRSRSRSRTPGGFRRVSPGGGGGAGGGGRKPPPREPPPFDGRDMSPGTHERWERDGYRQWERDYRDYYKYYRDYDGQPPHHRAHGSRDRERDRLSPPPRDYSPQGKSRRGRDGDRGAPSFHQPSSSSGTKSSSKSSKSKKVKKKKNGDESEAAHQSMDRGDATPVRDEPMDDAPNLSKTPPSSSKSSSAAKAATSKSSSSSASAKTSSKSGKTSSDKSKKDKTSKVKVKVKTEAAKVKGKKAVPDAAPAKKKEGSSSSSSTTAAAAPPPPPPPPPPLSKSSKTTKAPGPEETSVPAVVKKDKAKAPAPRPVPIKPRLVSSRIQPPPPPVLLDPPRPVVDLHGGRDPLKNAGLLPLPMQHGLLMLPHHPSFQMDKRRRPGEERPPFLLGLPPNKLRCIGVPGMGLDRLPHTQMVLPAQLLRVPSAMDRPGILPTPGAPRDPGRGDMGQRDMGQRDLGQRDLGQRDLGQRDLGQRDLGQRDMGQRDMGQRDMGQRDMGQRDMGQRDLGQRDLGQRDLGQRDLGQRDMGLRDMGLRDMGQRDIGQRDIGQRDIGQRDIGQRDIGQRDMGQRDVGQRDMGWVDIRPLMDLQVKPMAPRRIKLNRDLGRKNSTEGPSTDKPPAAPEKTPSATDKASSGSTPTGERPPRGPEPTGRRERSVSRERGGSRERPGSGRDRDQRMGLDRDRDRVSGADRERDRIPGSDRERDTNLGTDRERDRISRSDRDRDRDRDRISGSDRDRERVSGSDRDRDRPPGSDRERDRGPASDRERDRLPGSDKGRERAPGSGKERDRSRGPDRERGQSSDSDRHREKTSAAPAAEKMAVTVERDAADGQRLVKTDKSDSGGGAVGRSVSVDKMTIAERSAIARKTAEPAEKARRSSKEKDAESSEKGPKTDRAVSKDRAERTGTSGEKPAAAPREAGKGSDSSATKSRSRVNRKALTSRPSGSRPAETGRSDSDQNQRSGSSKDSDPRSQSPGDGRKHSPTPEPSPGRVEVLIQPPPRSKWERDDEEEWPENGLAAPAEKPASPPRGREKEKHPDAPKPVKSLARDGPKEEKRGAAKEEKTTTPAATTTTGKGVKQEGKAVKTSQAVKAKAPRDESRGHGRTDGRSGEREEPKGVAAKEERAPGGAGREESRGPEPRRQRLCSDLGRETDEAAFVPDYSEGEGSEPQKGGSVSASPSHSVASGSPAHSNASGSVATTATGDKKKKKKRKKDKKHKKHKKHSGQDAPEDAESKERKHKHKKKKHKKSKEAEEPGSKTPQE